MSYMVGYGARFPEQVHHRGASVPSIKSSPGKITCKGGFVYYSRDAPNPIVIVGGPDGYDWYEGIAGNLYPHDASACNFKRFGGIFRKC
jgi:hypothetical protein